jgi:hypothetical protein
MQVLKISKTYYFLFILLMSVNVSLGQGYKATAKLDPNTILIGDQVSLSLSFSFPSGTMVAWPSIKDTILGNIQVIGRTNVDTSWSADKKNLRLTQKLRLTCFDSGFYTIPPIRFYYRNLPDTTIRFEQTDIQILTVHTLTVDTTLAIKPIKGPVKIPFSIMEYIPWILAGILFLAIAGFLIYYLIRRRKGEPVFLLRPNVKYQPHEWALMELEKLRVKKLWQAGRMKEYHTELTDILRKYIEDRFRLMAMESTTDEILKDLEDKTAIRKEFRDSLGKILSMADLVKFAKYLPIPEDHEQSMEYAVDFINNTFATPVVPETKEYTASESGGLQKNSKEKETMNEPVTKTMN